MSNFRLVWHLLLLTALLAASPANAEESVAVDGTPLAVPSVAGSLAPHLATGTGNELLLSWIEPLDDGHRLVYSLLDDTWSDAHIVTDGGDWFVNWADFPSVVPISDEIWAAHWLVSQPAGGYAYDVLLSVSMDRGVTWSEPIIPHRDGTASEHGFVTLFPHASGFGAVWLDGRKTVRPFDADDVINTGMTLRAAAFTPALALESEAEVDELVCDCCQTDVAISAAGPVAVYRDRNTAEIRDIAVARWLDGGWVAGGSVADDEWYITGCPVNGPAAVADGADVAVAWFSAASGEPRVRVARSADSGASFAQPVEVAGNSNFGRVQVAMLAGGDLAVSWLCKARGEAAGVCLRRVRADDSLGPVRLLSGSQDVMSLSVPQLAVFGASLVAAWTARIDGETRIRSVRLVADTL